MTLEQRILDEVAAGREELVELTSTLIGFDTTAREPDDPARAEADLQAYLGERLSRAGAAVDIWEPAAGRRRGHAPDPRRAWRSTAARSWPPASPAPAAGRACS